MRLPAIRRPMAAYSLRSLPRLTGPMLTLAVIVALYALSGFFEYLKGPGPILLIFVIYSAASGGYVAGLISCALVLSYLVHHMLLMSAQSSLTPEMLSRHIILFLAAPASALLVGYLKRRADEAASEKRARSDAETSHQRTLFLADASARLDSTLDYKGTIRSLAKLAVPELADWCSVDILEDGSMYRRLAAAHRDPAKEELLYEEPRQRTLQVDSDLFCAEAIRTGQPLIRTAIRPEERSRLPDLPAELQPHALMVVPLMARGRKLGAITLATVEGKRSYDGSDLALVVDLANRAALAVDNARLFTELQQANSILNSTLDSTADGILVTDLQGNIQAYNDRFARMWRLSREPLSLRGQKLLRLMVDQLKDPETHARKVAELSEHAEAEGFDVLEFKDGRIFERYSLPQRLEGYSIGRVWSYRDVTENRHIEAARSRAEERLRTVLRNAPIIITTVDLNGIVTLSTGRGLRALRPEGESVVGISVFELYKKHPQIPQHVRRALTGESFTTLIEMGELTFDTYFGPLWEDGKISGAMGVSTDVSAWKRSERKRAQLLVSEINARAQAEQAQRRSSFLSEVSTLLADSVYYPANLESVAAFVVPFLGDLCSIELIDEETGKFRMVAFRSMDPAEVPAPAAPPESKLEVSCLGDQEIIAPLTARDRWVGRITLRNTRSGRRYRSQDHELAQELARRVAMAVDNARLYRQAQEAIAVRDEFISIASHELKTPLTSLRLQIQISRELGSLMVIRDPRAAKLNLLLENAEKQVTLTTQLINNLMDVSRIAARRFELQLEEFDFATAVRDVVARFDDELVAAGCQAEVLAPTPAVGVWDRLRIEQMITNLLSNAIKYGKGKPVEINVEPGESSLIFSVRDHGIGIPPEHQGRIFERFERGAVSGKKFKGLGLGLYITKQIVDAHGGNIRVASTPGEGSLFRVELPRKATAKSGAGARVTA